MGESRRGARCQQCGEWVNDEGWSGHMMWGVGYNGEAVQKPCGPVDFEERRKGERRVTVAGKHYVRDWIKPWIRIESPNTPEKAALFGPTREDYIEDRRVQERRKGEGA